MAIKLDKARPATVSKLCATADKYVGTARGAAFTRSFFINIDKIETHIPGLMVAVAPIVNAADAHDPVISYAGFFLPSTAKTKFQPY